MNVNSSSSFDYTSVYSDLTLEFFLQKDDYNSSDVAQLSAEMFAFGPFITTYAPFYGQTYSSFSREYKDETEYRVELKRFYKNSVMLYKKAQEHRKIVLQYFANERISDQDLAAIFQDSQMVKESLKNNKDIFPHRVLVKKNHFTGWAPVGWIGYNDEYQTNAKLVREFYFRAQIESEIHKEIPETRDEEFSVLLTYYNSLLDILPRYMPPSQFEINYFSTSSRQKILEARSLVRNFIETGEAENEVSIIFLAKKILDPISMTVLLGDRDLERRLNQKLSMSEEFRGFKEGIPEDLTLFPKTTFVSESEMAIYRELKQKQIKFKSLNNQELALIVLFYCDLLLE